LSNSNKDTDGIAALIGLAQMAGIEKLVHEAKDEWFKMSESEKEGTMRAFEKMATILRK